LTLTAQAADDSPSEHPQHQEPTPPGLRPVPRALVSSDGVATAQALLGVFLVRDDKSGRRVARIVETEAYMGPGDKASHARAGRTARTSVMFGPPGHAYVYLVYGMHHCLNVVCGADGAASAVLLRALEPVTGAELMRQRRARPADPDERLAAGPARACQALDIDRSLGGIDLLTDDRLRLTLDPAGPLDPARIVSGPRIGVEYAGPDWAQRPWRFGIADSPALSKSFPVNA
jgi:DNA-3-methyladenine glycosylase